MAMEQFKDKKVTEKNLKEFMDLDKNGYAHGRFDYQTGGDTATQLVPFDGELDKPKATVSNKLVPFDGDLDEPSVGEIAGGLGEAGLNFVSQMPGAMAGGVGYLTGLAASGGDLGFAKHAQEETNKAINEYVEYEPRTKMGKKIQKDIQEGMSDAITQGGKVAEQLPGAASMGLLDKFAKENQMGLNAIGEAGTEIAMNVVDPLAMVGIGAPKGMPKAHIESANKLEKLQQQLQPEPEVAPVQTGTVAHADDFAAINPYDTAGHVTASEQGRPAVIDNPQGDLFGGKHLQDSMAGPSAGQMSLLHDSVPFDRLELGGEPQAPRADLQMPMVPDRLELVPKETTPEPVVEQIPNIGTRDVARAKQAEITAEQRLAQAKVAGKASDIEAAYRALDDIKETQYNLMEGQKELQFADSIKNIEERSVARTAFLDRANLDFQEASKSGDKTLMSPDQTIMMRGFLRRGDVTSALKAIQESHPIPGYRDLAAYLTDKLDGLKVKLHDESMLQLGERSVTGYYDPQTHTVGLSGLGATSPHTVLHELTHAVTSHFINTRPNDMRVTGLKALFKEVSKSHGMENFRGIVNVKEFVAEAFSNPKFQEFLKTQHMNQKTVFQRFVDGVKAIFGIRGHDPMVNAFEHAMDLGKQVIEAQIGREATLEQFKKANLPNKLADLMAQKPKDTRPEIVQNEAVQTITKKLPGLEHAVSDFAFYDKPIEQIVQMAREPNDIPNTKMEKFAQQMQGGALFESLKTRNPVVKATYEKVTRAFQEAAHNVKENLTNPETGIKRYMRDLNPEEKGEIHAVMMIHEGQRELTSTELAAAGMNEKQIAYYNKQRELDNQFYEAINKRRVEAGLTPMDKRVAHIAGRFMGDFAHMVFKDGKVVGRISGNTAWELKRVREYIANEHPDYEFGEQEYRKIGQGRQAKDRFSGLMEAINFVEKADGDVKALMDSYRGYLQKDAVNYLNATRHAKAKVKEAGGIIGSEGNKPWQDTIKNAEEGMKAQLDYYEQGYQWMAMEKAVSDLKKVLGDKEVVKNNPNAVKYAESYIDHAMGRNQGVFSDAANAVLSMVGQGTGFGHTNILKLNNNVKHLIMQKFMGLGNIPFTVTQLSQPFQTQPAMIRLIRSRGLEFSTAQAQLRATETYIKSMLVDHGGEKLSDFEKQAVKYADQMSIFDVKMADHTKNINASRFKEGYDKLADLNITAPEHLTRGMTFLFYSHALKEAGVPHGDIFSAAENMTNMSMVNYHRIERPMGYAKLGWLGDVASTLTRYKHNQWSQLAMYGREAGRTGSYSPLATFLGTSLAFGGVMGFFAYQEADAAYQLFSEHVLKKPDSLTNLALKLPEVVSHGVFSSLGMDMTTRFSNANVLPDSIPAAIMPYGSAVWDMAASTGRFAFNPTNGFKFKQMVKSMAPQSAQGLLENQLFTEKQPNGKGLYINSTDGPNLGKGRVERSDSDMTMRAFGFRNMGESKELAKNYSDSQIDKQHKNIADSLLTKIKYGILGNNMSQQEMSNLIQKAVVTHGADPNKFVGELVSWGESRKLTQAQQQKLRNAQGGYSGAWKESQR